MRLSASSSASDSTLIWPMPSVTACRSSAVGLADAREHDLCRRYAGLEGNVKFAAGNYIAARAEIGQGSHYREVAVRFHRETDAGIHALECVAEHQIVTR